MTVPPDITILLIFAVVFIVAVYFVDRKIQKGKPTLKVKRHPTPKVQFHKPQKDQEK